MAMVVPVAVWLMAREVRKHTSVLVLMVRLMVMKEREGKVWVVHSESIFWVHAGSRCALRLVLLRFAPLLTQFFEFCTAMGERSWS